MCSNITEGIHFCRFGAKNAGGKLHFIGCQEMWSYLLGEKNNLELKKHEYEVAKINQYYESLHNVMGLCGEFVFQYGCTEMEIGSTQ